MDKQASMLFQTLQSLNYQNKTLINPFEYVNLIKLRLQNILEEFWAQQKILNEKYEKQKLQLKAEITQKSGEIEKLSRLAHQLQKQNQQIKFQYDQRGIFLKILKEENRVLLGNSFIQKEKHKETMIYLIKQMDQAKNLAQVGQKKNRLISQLMKDTSNQFQKNQKISSTILTTLNSQKVWFQKQKINQDLKSTGQINGFQINHTLSKQLSQSQFKTSEIFYEPERLSYQQKQRSFNLKQNQRCSQKQVIKQKKYFKTNTNS